MQIFLAATPMTKEEEDRDQILVMARDSKFVRASELPRGNDSNRLGW
jgi:hypothetical protein